VNPIRGARRKRFAVPDLIRDLRVANEVPDQVGDSLRRTH
jgi:hypothetical protein